MDWQFLLVALLVIAAAGYLARQSWRSWGGKKTGCAGGCGCAKSAPESIAPPLIPPEQLVLRRR